jgi:hypothetical protein
VYRVEFVNQYRYHGIGVGPAEQDPGVAMLHVLTNGCIKFRISYEYPRTM